MSFRKIHFRIQYIAPYIRIDSFFYILSLHAKKIQRNFCVLSLRCIFAGCYEYLSKCYILLYDCYIFFMHIERYWIFFVFFFDREEVMRVRCFVSGHTFIVMYAFASIKLFSYFFLHQHFDQFFSCKYELAYRKN